MPDINASFFPVNGLSITGSSVINFVSATGPTTNSVLRSSGTTGNVLWGYPATPDHYTGGSRLLIPCNSSTQSATNTGLSAGTVVYFPFVVYSAVTVKAAVSSTASTPTLTGPVYCKLYGTDLRIGGPTGAPISDLGTITVNAVANTISVSSGSVQLTPGMYWLGMGFTGAGINNMRRITADTNQISHTFGQATPAGTPTYFVYFSQAGITVPPDTVGAITQVTSAVAVGPFLQMQ
jgi:hypothetical protein